MTRTKRPFPPSILSDLSTSSASNLLSLLKHLKQGPVTLALGAGVSASAGLPDWAQLLRNICAMFFVHWDFDIERKRLSINEPPRDLSVAFVDEFFWEDGQAMDRACRFCQGDALLAAQLVKNCITTVDWRYLLRHALYGDYPYTADRSHLVDSLVRLCSSSGGTIGAVLNYNYDDLFRLALDRQNIPSVSLWYGKATSASDNRLRIYHPHGISSLHGSDISRTTLAEDDYQQELRSPFSWANLVQTGLFTGSTCIFVGASMTDPNLRRLLAASVVSSRSPHYAFLPRSGSDRDATMFDALFDQDLLRIGVRPIRFDKRPATGNEFSRLHELLDMCSDHLANGGLVWS